MLGQVLGCHVAIEKQIEQSTAMRISNRLVNSFSFAGLPHRTSILLKHLLKFKPLASPAGCVKAPR